jgi:hypothetical protein
MSTVERRLKRLEKERARQSPCPECGLPPDRPGEIVLIHDGTPAEGFPDDPHERCKNCGRALWCVINIVYDSPETQGEGTSYGAL